MSENKDSSTITPEMLMKAQIEHMKTMESIARRALASQQHIEQEITRYVAAVLDEEGPKN